ncbi:hypothetical protein Tco_1489896 [Tanacetum coccineum]
MDMEVDSDDEMNDPILIFPYEAMCLPYLPPPKSNTSSDSKSEAAIAATVGTITQVPRTGCRFLVLTRHMSTREAAEASAQSRERKGRKHMDLLDFDLGVMEHKNGKIEHVVVTLEDHVLKLEHDRVREENKRLKKKLKYAKMSDTLVRIDRDLVERDLYHLRVWAYGFYGEMVRSGVAEERSCEAIDVLATFGETQPIEPRGSPRDS